MSRKPTSRIPAAVHVDLDGAKDIYRIHGWPYPWPDDPLFETGLLGLLELFDRHGICATLFVIAGSLDDPRKLDLVREAVRRGHEVASHSFSHADLRRLDRPAKQREIAASRERIEDRLGVAVRGFRAPGYGIDRESIELVSLAGYVFDSSAFPTRRFARRLGVSVAALSNQPRPFAGSPLVEIPLPSAHPFPLPFHPSYSLFLGLRYFRSSLVRFLRRGRPLVLLFHLTDAAAPLPRERLSGTAQRIFTLSTASRETKLARCQAMLDLVLERCRCLSTRALLEEWAGR